MMDSDRKWNAENPLKIYVMGGSESAYLTLVKCFTAEMILRGEPLDNFQFIGHRLFKDPNWDCIVPKGTSLVLGIYSDGMHRKLMSAMRAAKDDGITSIDISRRWRHTRIKLEAFGILPMIPGVRITDGDLIPLDAHEELVITPPTDQEVADASIMEVYIDRAEHAARRLTRDLLLDLRQAFGRTDAAMARILRVDPDVVRKAIRGRDIGPMWTSRLTVALADLTGYDPTDGSPSAAVLREFGERVRASGAARATRVDPAAVSAKVVEAARAAGHQVPKAKAEPLEPPSPGRARCPIKKPEPEVLVTPPPAKPAAPAQPPENPAVFVTCTIQELLIMLRTGPMLVLRSKSDADGNTLLEVRRAN